LTAEDLTSVVELAREPDIPLGGGRLRPSRRELVIGGDRIVVEPRAMRVLVALLRGRGEVVSRDELIASCWDGRIVGDDAINGCVAKVRRLGEATGAFAVETVARVGYRAQAKPTRRPAVGEPDATEGITLAVLAFENLSDDPTLGYFSDGVSEEILNTLARRAGLRVIGRSSSFQLRGAEKAAANVAQRLGATHLLDGAVRRSGSRMRVSAQLISCATQATLWAYQVEREVADVFALQDEVAAAAAAALSHALASREPLRPIDPEAFDLYLRARASTERWFGESDPDLLERCVARAPEFAGAWAALALTRAVQSLSKERPTSAVAALQAAAVRAADRTLALDPGAGIALVAKALVLPVCGAFEERERLLAQAVKASPQDARVLFHAAHAAECAGRLTDALRLSARARALEPSWPQGLVQLASILEDTGDPLQADQVFDEARARWPTLAYVIVSAMFRAAHARRWSRVDALTEDLRRRGPMGPESLRAIGRIAQLREADGADARAVIERERRRVAETGAMALSIAPLCLAGYADEAFDLVERASFDHLFEATGKTVFGDLGLHGLFFAMGRTMRADPRFVRLCAKLGWAQYWVATDGWPDCADETAPFYDFRAECRRAVNQAPRRA